MKILSSIVMLAAALAAAGCISTSDFEAAQRQISELQEELANIKRTASSKDEVQNSSALIGRPAPAVVGTGFRGDSFDLDTQRGNWVIVNFFSTTCVPCIQEHPELKEWSDRHAASGLMVAPLPV